ncbi:MAG: TlpA disulfide reductase family protein [Ignavibacteriaceae bacterium]
MKLRKFFVVFLFVISLIFCACLKEVEENPNHLRNSSSKKENKIEVKKIGESELQQRIENRNGKILFINVWATWCVPCVEEFPDIVKIANEYKNKDVEFLSLSVDFESQIDSTVIPFLKKLNVNFPVLLINEKESEKIIDLLNRNWSGAIPATFIYDKQGAQKVFLSGAQKFISFKEKIDSVYNL